MLPEELRLSFCANFVIGRSVSGVTAKSTSAGTLETDPLNASFVLRPLSEEVKEKLMRIFTLGLSLTNVDIVKNVSLATRTDVIMKENIRKTPPTYSSFTALCPSRVQSVVGLFYPSQGILQSAVYTEGPEGSYRNVGNPPSRASVKSRNKSGVDKSNTRKNMQICTSQANLSESSTPSGRTKTFFLCRFCDRPFNLRSNCKVHERRHTGERPFKCRTCPKLFVSGSERKAHENLHSGAKPFKCRYCEKGFASTGNRCHHEKKHKRETST